MLPRPRLPKGRCRERDGGAAIDLQRGCDVLDEVELLVGGGDPEIGTTVGDVFALGPSVDADHGDRRLATKRWIRQLHRRRFRFGGQGVPDSDHRLSGGPTDAVQVQVHGPQSRGRIDQFNAVDHAALTQRPPLLRVHGIRVVLVQILDGREEKPPAPQARGP